MTKKNDPAIFAKFLASLEEDPTFKRACQICSITSTTLYRWLGASQKFDPAFVVKYLDDEPTPFHIAVKQAQQIYYHAFVQDAERSAKFGDYRQTYFRGQPQYHQDPQFMNWDPKDLHALGIDPYLRDSNGNLLPVMEWHPPSAALRLAALAARAPKLYGTKIEHNVNTRTSLGVTVVQQNKPAAALPPVEIVPTLPAPEPGAEDAEFTEADFLDPETDEKAAYWERATVAADEPEPAPVVSGNPEVSKAPSPLRAELEALARLRARNPRPQALPRGTGSGSSDQDDCAPRPIPPGAMKLR
jgi:hypothetical protein